jgi:hypothetical protein
MVNMIHLAGPEGSHTSERNFTTAGLQGFHKEQIFSYNYFVTGEDNKAVFLIPGNTVATAL